jgi:Helix-turn-helix domain
MEHIAGRVAEIARNIEIVGADPVTRHGFTQVPNVILTDEVLSVGAKLAYAILLKYAWDAEGCFPGQIRLAQDMGSGERSVRRYLEELEQTGFLEVEQRGLGKTNYYRLHLTVKGKGKKAGQSRPAKLAGQDRP